jgi:hypothetical protein
MDIFRIIANREIQADDFMFDDDIVDPSFASDVSLPLSSRTGFSHSALLNSVCSGADLQLFLNQACLPTTVFLT